MLYYLFEWLHKLNFPGAGMFGYTLVPCIDGYHPGTAYFQYLGR